MRGGLRWLVNPATPVSDINVTGSRAARRALHDELRARQQLQELLEGSAPGDGLVSIRRLEVIDGEQEQDDDGGLDGAA